MPSSNATTEKAPSPIPSTPTNDLVTTLSLGEVLRTLRLDHAASLLDAATGKAITRNDSPTSLLDCEDARPSTTSDSEARDSGSADANQPDADAMGGETGDAADTGAGATDAAGADGEVSHSCVSVTGGGKEPWPDLQITGSQFDAFEGRRIRIVVSSNPGGRLGVAEATIASGAFELTLAGTFNYGYYTEIDLYIDDNANSACDVGEPLWGHVTGIVQENLRVDVTPAGLCLSGGGPSMFQGCASWTTPAGPCFINGEADLRMRLPCPP